jgi:hypothetical protein
MIGQMRYSHCNLGPRERHVPTKGPGAMCHATAHREPAFSDGLNVPQIRSVALQSAVQQSEPPSCIEYQTRGL